MSDTTNLVPRLLDRLLKPASRCLNPESARSLAALPADPPAQTRVGELTEKCNEGTLTPEEREEYETGVRVGNLIAILQAQTRTFLRNQAST